MQLSETFFTCCICGYTCDETSCECTGRVWDGDDETWCDPGCTTEKATIRNAKGEVIEVWEDDAVEVVDLERPGNAFAIFVGSYGISSESLRYVLYSAEPPFKKVGVIKDLVAKYQASNGRCEGWVPDGFYRGDEGYLWVDTFSLRAGYENESMSTRKYDVVTLRFDGEKISRVGRKPFEMGSYERPPGEMLTKTSCD